MKNILSRLITGITCTALIASLSLPALAAEVPADQNTTVYTQAQATEDTLTNGKPVTEENVLELLRQIEQDWPTGTVWGTHNTPDTHKNEVPSTASGQIMRGYHVSNTYGCGAYASMVSSLKVTFTNGTEPPPPPPDNPPPTPTPGKAILFKRDANTNKGVGPATFKFSSVVNGVYEFDTNATGELETIQ